MATHVGCRSFLSRVKKLKESDPMTTLLTRRFALSLTLGAASALIGCSTLEETSSTNATKPSISTSSKGQSSVAAETTPQEAADLWRLMVDGYKLPPIDDSKVANHLRWYGNNQRHIDRVTLQGKPFLHHIVSELENNELPSELALIPFIESAYNPFAQSPSRAVGIWQFMPMTARHFGLKQTPWYDGRRDVIASTEAAVTYFKRLASMFDNDWLLVLAAYNAGEGTVKRAIEKNRRAGKPTDFWSLPLPKQTQKYVPQLIALSKIFATPQKYGLEIEAIPNTPHFATIELDKPIDLAQAARHANIDTKEMRQLNAGYGRWITAPSGTHHVLVPSTHKENFTKVLATLPSIKVPSIGGDYRVKAGDTLGAIAKRHGTSVAEIQQLNGLKNHNLRIGQTLSIPGQAALTSPYAKEAEQQLATSAQPNASLHYTVKSGDSFWSIAKKHGVSVKNLLKWNDLSEKARLKPGQKLLVAASSSNADQVTYQIRAGDTLHKIANKFDVSKEQLLSWNQVKDESYIHPGQELTIHFTKK